MLEDVRLPLIDLDGRRGDIGDLGSPFGYDVLNQAFRQVMDGAELIARQKNRYWTRADRLSLDVGPFVAAIEFAASRDAYVVGRPAKEFFEQVLASVGVDASAATMVGDDIESDISGALRARLDAILVRTGKHREDRARESGIHRPASSTRSPTCPRYSAPDPRRSSPLPRPAPDRTSSSTSATTQPPRHPGMLPAQKHGPSGENSRSSKKQHWGLTDGPRPDQQRDGRR